MKRRFKSILSLLIVLSIMFGSISTVFGANSRDYYLDLINDRMNNPTYKLQNGFVAESKNGKFRIINKEGKEITPYIYDSVDQFGFENGLLGVVKDGKWGFINELGEEVVKTIYDQAGTLNGFLLIIKNNKRGLMSRQGKEILPPIYDSIYPIDNGLIIVEKDEKSGIVNESGKELIPAIYDVIDSDYNGFIAIKKDDKVGLLSKKGVEILPPVYDGFSFAFEGSIAVVKDGKWGIVNESGKELVPLIYDGISADYSGFIAVRKDNKMGLLSKKGVEILPPVYDGISFTFEGFIPVLKDGKSGVVNELGEELVPIIYDEIVVEDENEGILKVYKDGNETVIYLYDNKAKKESFLSNYDYVSEFKDGFAGVEKDGKWGVINELGEEIVPLIYDYIDEYVYVDGFDYLITIVIKDDKIGIINEFGQDIIPVIYDDIFIDEEENIVGYIDGTKKIIYLEELQNKPEKIIRATSTNANVLVNNIPTEFEAYTINDNNYFKLRDLAKVISGSEKQFEVKWDNDKKAINLISNKPYTIVGGEMIQGDGQEKKAKANTSKIYIDGKEANLKAYNIGGNNYFKLRDIAKAFDIGITWDGTTKTIGIDTNKSYITE